MVGTERSNSRHVTSARAPPHTTTAALHSNRTERNAFFLPILPSAIITIERSRLPSFFKFSLSFSLTFPSVLLQSHSLQSQADLPTTLRPTPQTHAASPTIRTRH